MFPIVEALDKRRLFLHVETQKKDVLVIGVEIIMQQANLNSKREKAMVLFDDINKVLGKIDAQHKEISMFRTFKDKNLLHQIHEYYKIENTWSSNAIEGNSYTLSETKILLEDGLTAGGKPLKHALEAKGHAEAWDYMFSLLHMRTVSEENLLFMHRLLQGLENDAIPGTYRNRPVFITGSKYATQKAKLVPEAMKKLVASQERLFAKFHPVIAAAKFHKKLAFIHPFADGNGRIARLAMNCLLIQRGFLPASIPPVLKHDYIASLERAHVNDEDFVSVVLQAEYETQKDFLRMLKECGAEPYDADTPAEQKEASAPEGLEGRMPEEDASESTMPEC